MIIRITYKMNGFIGSKIFDNTKYCSTWIKSCNDIKITSLKISGF